MAFGFVEYDYVPITDTQAEDSIDLPCSIFKLLMFAAGAKCVFLLDATVGEAVAFLERRAVVGFDCEDSQILTCDIEAG